MAIKISNLSAKKCAFNDIKESCKKGETYLWLIQFSQKSLPFKQSREQLLTLSTPTIQNY